MTAPNKLCKSNLINAPVDKRLLSIGSLALALLVSQEQGGMRLSDEALELSLV